MKPLSAVTLVCVIVIGCSDKPRARDSTVQPSAVRGSASGRIATEAEAVSRFHQVRMTVGFIAQPEERVTAERLKARDCLALIKGSLTPAAMKSSIRGGELMALETDEYCWAVVADQGIIGGQAAYFDDVGQLLLAWQIPEG